MMDGVRDSSKGGLKWDGGIIKASFQKKNNLEIGVGKGKNFSYEDREGVTTPTPQKSFNHTHICFKTEQLK